MASGIALAGDLQTASREALVNKWTSEGRVFISGTPVAGTPETMSAAGTAYTLTAPSIRYTIPSGKLVVPIHAAVSGTRVITKDDLFGVIVSETDTYTSGGEACKAARNAIVQGDANQVRGVGVTNLLHSDTAIVEAALVNYVLLKSIKHEGVTGEVDAPWNPEYNILKGDPMVYIVGPASFLVFAVQETTAMEAEFSLSWAELDIDDFTA
jgi:hypothetical protein